MKVDLYSFVGMYAKGLATLANVLTKGAQYAGGRGISEDQMLDWRLAPDMFPLRRQAQIVCNFAKQWPARAAGVAVPPAVEGKSSLADLHREIVDATEVLNGLRPGQFDGRDDVPLTHDIGLLRPTLELGQWISGFATTNFYFHLAMAYAILRHHGVPLGKPDFFAGGL